MARKPRSEWTADVGLKTAPLDEHLIATLTVRNSHGHKWWEKHIILINGGTGEIDDSQGWDREDYTHWMLAPADPVST